MTRKDFHHPFQPYSVQQEFMLTVYDCLERGGVGILESPTGTGKSLSLICGSLTWLREHKRKSFDEAIQGTDDGDDEPDWMADHARLERSREIRQMRADFDARLSRVREREKKIRQRSAADEPLRKKVKAQDDAAETPDVEQFVLDDYVSDEEGNGSHEQQYSDKTTALMEKMGMLRKQNPDEDAIDTDELKIFFCSRTHSQLSQFVGELQRVKLPPGLPPEQTIVGAEATSEPVEEIKHLSLGARKNLCINPKVSKLSSPTAINERCIELQQSKTSADQKCQFLPNRSNEDVVLDFRDHALSTLGDIEDLAKLGKRLQICPYYASRPAIGPAEIVTLPYPLLLQETAREALGISLKGHVVIFDEAHNLISAVEGTHSTQISSVQLQQAKDVLIVYLQKFRNRLKGSNRVYVTQVVRVIDSLLQFTTSVQGEKSEGATTTPGALLAGKAVDQINLTKLVRYMHESRLARKVEGYRVHLSSQTVPARGAKQNVESEDAEMPTLMQIQNFLLTLMNPSSEGRFIWSKEQQQDRPRSGSPPTVTIRYLLLDPSAHFRPIVEAARAVILAGGTMSPIPDYAQQLFPYLPPASLTTFSCGHLIPPSSLFVRTLTHDDEDQRLDFSFKGRSPETIIRLGKILCRIAKQVIGGLIIFLPSYSFLEEVTKLWKTVDIHGNTLNNHNDPQTTHQSLWTTLESIKPVFADQRATATPANRHTATNLTNPSLPPAESLFKSYSTTIQTDPTLGAILLSVLGGKLSEGINFSNDLGRCVIVIGLPFPNIHAPDLRAKLAYLDTSPPGTHSIRPQQNPSTNPPSRAYLENSCMRSVNQAIGRAIRHKDDWASIILCDARFGDERIFEKLPGWIRAGAPPKEFIGKGTPRVVEDGLKDWFEGMQQRREGLEAVR